MANEPLIVLSAGAALTYGALLSTRPLSAARTVIKTLAVAPLAILVMLQGGHPLIAAGLAACAVGDAFLAGELKRWLPFGLGAFLLAHGLYAAAFLTTGNDLLALTQPVRIIGLLLTLAGGGAMLASLWVALGPLRLAVGLYVAAIVVMVASSLLLPPASWPVMAGAVAFFASDGILAAGLFRGSQLLGSERLSAWTVWGLYYLGQAGITVGFLQ